MVNTGPSKACLTCKRRKIKCDEAKPACARCTLASLDCNWSKPAKTPDIRFVDETRAVAARHQGIQMHRRITTLTAPTASLHDDRETQALAFFERHYMLSQIPDGGPNPGLFGFFLPALSAPRNSPAAMAVSALALSIYSRWRMDYVPDKRVPKVLSQAIWGLSKDLQRDDSRRSDITLLTTLTLQFHSSFESLFSSNKATIVHHLGALALVKEFGPPASWTTLAGQFVGYILHVEVAAAIRERRRVHSELRRWSSIITSISMSPNSHLDALGIKVADVQVQFYSMFAPVEHELSPLDLEGLLTQAQDLDDSLVSWEQRVLHLWGPFCWEPPGLIIPPIQTFEGACEIYTSVQAARLMNIWRSYRLTLSLLSLQLINEQQGTKVPTPDKPSNTRCSTYTLVKRIQWLVDGVCASVPFFLGNRTKVGTVLDFGDPSWRFPSCHDMSEMYDISGRAAEPEGLESLESHKSHVIAQGVWLIMGNLTQLAAFFLENDLTPLFPLRRGQLSWICHQYLRNLSLLSIEWTYDTVLVEQVLTGFHLPEERKLIAEAKRCVQRVLRGLRMTGDS